MRIWEGLVTKDVSTEATLAFRDHWTDDTGMCAWAQRFKNHASILTE